MTENSYLFAREQMPRTPGSREVIKIVGDPSTITRRGTDIVELGDMMSRAARTLELFANGTIGKGESFDSVRDQASEVHGDLATAAKRYGPSGDALVAYASALSTVQAATDALVDQAAAAWSEVNEASHALGQASSAQSTYDFEANHDQDPAGDRPSTAAQQQAFDARVGDFQSYLNQYDAPVEVWESAYDTALQKLEKTTADGISDGFWDNAMPFIEGLLKVLTVVCVILIIAAFVLTGPLAAIAAALAVVVGVVSLLGELARLHTGRGSWGEVALAAIGVFPFGKLAKLGNLADFAAVGSKFPRLTGSIRLIGSEFSDARAGFKALDGLLEQKLNLRLFDYGLNTRNMLRGLYGPSLAWEAKAFTGSLGNGWRALAGFAPGSMPQTLGQALAGSAQAYAQGLVGLMGIKSIAGWGGVG